jgi:hypothetical protein
MASGAVTAGERAPDVEDPRGWRPILEPGQYRRTVHPEHGPTWECCTPNGHQGNLGRHEVVEHDDETITVSPSILVSVPPGTEVWHGYLEHGVWREV